MDKKVVENDIYKLSKGFALRMVKMYKYLIYEEKEFILSKQVMRSGTGIGANVHEAKYAQSKADFVSKMHIALKEASETLYWLDLLYEAEFIGKTEYQSVYDDCDKIVGVLSKIVKTSKASLPDKA